MFLVATAMPKEEQQETENFCTYASVKIDDQLLPFLKAAAAFAGVPVQEYLSDVVNDTVPKAAGKKPIKRRPPRP